CLAASAAAATKVDPIELKQGATTYKGFIAYDDTAKDKRPGILVIHEWWGCNEYAKHRATQLADLGYVAIAVDMYGDGKSTTDAAEAGKLSSAARADAAAFRDRINGWLGVLKARKEVDPGRTAAIGYCFGGSTALELARSGADVKAVVSFHGALGTKSPAAAGQVKAKVLACNGADDTFVSADERAKFQAEMKNAGVDLTWKDYPGAVHSFTNPDADSFKIPGVAYNKAADEQSWKAMQ